MGSVSLKRRVQIGISKHTRISRHKENNSFKKCHFFSFRRNKFSFRKRCYRESKQSADSGRFLQYLFHGSQKVRGDATSFKSKTTEQVPQEKAFQNGYAINSSKFGETKRLGYNHRFDRCISSHTNISKTPKVSEILFSKPMLPVESNVLRSNISSTCFHKIGIGSGSLPQNTQCKTSSVSGRLVEFESNQRNVITESPVMPQSFDFTRFYSQSEEVQSCPKAENNFHRSLSSFGSRPSVSNRGKISENCSNFAGIFIGENESKTVLENSGINGFLYRTNTKCSSVYETRSDSSSQFLESSETFFRNGNSSYTTSFIASEMVARPSEHFQGQIFASKCNTDDYHNRCFQNHVRGTSGEQLHSGDMVRDSENKTHKFVRIRSSVSDSSPFSRSFEGEGSSSEIGQYNSGPVYQQARGDPFNSIMHKGLGSLEFGNSEQNQSQSSSYIWTNEYSGGSIEQDKNSAYRMVSKERNSDETVFDMGKSNNRSICVSGEPPDREILHLVPKQRSYCSRCSFYFMGEHVCVCLPSDLPHSKDSQTYVAVPLSADSNCSQMATETVVHRVITSADSTPNKDTSECRSTGTTQYNDLPSESRNVSADSMDVIDQQLLEKGFSRETRELLRAAWRKGTQKDYNSKFRTYNRWCGEWEIDPHQPTLVDIAHFLTYLFEKGLQYRTIAGYRSMLSAVLSPIEGFKVGQHPTILQLIKGTFNSRPPVRRLLPEWNLNKVLRSLEKAPFEPLRDTSLKLLTFKTVFLIAITCFRRCSDLQSLHIGEGSVTVCSSGITFRRHGLSKQDRQSHFGATIFIPAFPENRKLDPKRCLYHYLKRTEKYRKQGDGQEEDHLFLSLNEPHKAVSIQTISNWIVQTIRLALDNKDMKVKAHSTRAIGPSYALLRGASLNSILAAADWSRDSTFARFYLRNIPCEVLEA